MQNKIAARINSVKVNDAKATLLKQKTLIEPKSPEVKKHNAET